MAFDRRKLAAQAYGLGQTIWFYSTGDALSTVLAAGYFSPVQNHMSVGDVVHVSTGAGDHVTLRLTGTSPARTALDGAPYAAAPPALGLNGSHPLAPFCQVALACNEGAGSLVRDVSGNGRHAFLSRTALDTNKIYTFPNGTFADGHIQGLITDGAGGYLATSTTTIYKLAANFSITASRTNVPADLPAGIPARNHIGSPSLARGVIYAPVKYWLGNCATSGSNAIGMWRADDLSYLGCMSVGQVLGGSSVAVDTKRGLLWGVSTCNSMLQKCDLTTGQDMGALALSYPYLNSQAICYDAARDLLYILSDGEADMTGLRVLAVRPDDGQVMELYFLTGTFQCLALAGSDFLVANNPGGGGSAVYTVPRGIAPNWSLGRAGYVFDGGPALSIHYKLPPEGSIVTGFQPALTTESHLWDCLRNGNYWESTINADGSLMTQIEAIAGGGNIGRLTAPAATIKGGGIYQHTYAWKQGATARQFVNGTQKPASDVALAAWRETPEMISFGSLSPDNSVKGNGLLSYAFILSKQLTVAEAAMLAADPYALFSAPPR